jgi:hypothetical protein
MNIYSRTEVTWKLRVGVRIRALPVAVSLSVRVAPGPREAAPEPLLGRTVPRLRIREQERSGLTDTHVSAGIGYG